MPIDLSKQTFTSPNFQSVVEEAIKFMVASPEHILPPGDKFVGAGVYALYYQGSFEYYKPHVVANAVEATATPIYVGKAVQPGWRMARAGSKGGNAKPLYNRLSEHAKNIEQVENIQESDFRCRFMIMGGNEADLISATEAQLIRRFAPIWNTKVDGFGNHTPGKGRFNQAKSEWDVLHPGRVWASKCKGDPPSLESIIQKLDLGSGS